MRHLTLVFEEEKRRIEYAQMWAKYEVTTKKEEGNTMKITEIDKTSPKHKTLRELTSTPWK